MPVTPRKRTQVWIVAVVLATFVAAAVFVFLGGTTGEAPGQVTLGVCRRTHFDRTRSRRFWSGKSWPASFTVRRLPIADSEIVSPWVPSVSSSLG